MKKIVIGLCLFACALSAHVASAIEQPDASILQDIHHLRYRTWHFQRIMGVRPTPSSAARLAVTSHRYKLWVRKLWHRRALHTVRRFAHGPAHTAGWLCIHRYEGSWTDASAPYYGGLQMDLSFQRRYGERLLRTKGTADHWLRLEQIWVAERAHRSGRGFYPWPNTARACGLI